MLRSEIFCLSCSGVMRDASLERLIQNKKLLPLGFVSRIAPKNGKCTLKLRGPQTPSISETEFATAKDESTCIRIPDAAFSLVLSLLSERDYLFIVLEGVSGAITATLHFDDEAAFQEIADENLTLRLAAFDLPPRLIAKIDSPDVARPIYACLARKDEELFSLPAHRLLHSTHILGLLFAHVASLSSSDSIVFLDKLRIIADHLRIYLKPWIVKIEKDHVNAWADAYGEKVSFIDGGTSRIISLPGIAPTGIRVGTYTVTPGEIDEKKREQWSLTSHVIGDVLNDRSLIKEEFYQTDEKRLQEAARYILEALTVLRATEDGSSDVVLLHGPLQNPFETYNELDPCYIPGLNPDFLQSYGLDANAILNEIPNVPRDGSGTIYWNSPIAVYATIMKRLTKAAVPALGVVERAPLNVVTRSALMLLVAEDVITEDAKVKIDRELRKFDITDELLFGCILAEGEYLKPVETLKNLSRRARDRWKDVIRDFNLVPASMIKCSEFAFPFRVEFNRILNDDVMQKVMRLVYHTSLLLPRYAFPVGIDIADKYAKIPDWLSKGISAELAATIFKRCIQKGDHRLLEQMRNLLARSPRDFFYRPSP